MARTQFLTADAATALIADGQTVAVSGNGAGMISAEAILAALERRFLDTGHPRDLTLVHSLGLGDRGALGTNRLAHEGMIRKVIARYRADPARVVVAGMSSGAGLAAILGVRFPGLVRGVLAHSGIACGAASSALTALAVMKRGPETDVAAIATDARRASGTGAPVRLLVVHGGDDAIVATRHAAALAVLVAVSLGLSAQAAKADESVTCYIGPAAYGSFEFSASECDNYIIREGWISTAPGLAKEFQKAIHSSIYVYKEGGGFDLAYDEAQSAQFWWIMPFPSDYYGWDCAMPTLWANRWWVPIPVDLEPGNYVATYTWTLDHPVTDGWEACEPGEPIGKNVFSGTSTDSYYFTILP